MQKQIFATFSLSAFLCKALLLPKPEKSTGLSLKSKIHQGKPKYAIYAITVQKLPAQLPGPVYLLRGRGDDHTGWVQLGGAAPDKPSHPMKESHPMICCDARCQRRAARQVSGGGATVLFRIRLCRISRRHAASKG